jgi:hypothetical protein
MALLLVKPVVAGVLEYFDPIDRMPNFGLPIKAWIGECHEAKQFAGHVVNEFSHVSNDNLHGRFPF